MYNYSDPPFCKTFKDLDLQLLQFCLIKCNTLHFMNLCIHYFDIDDFMNWIYDSEMQTLDEYLPNSLESLLLLIINVVTELPLPSCSPQSQNHRLIQSLRREVVHKLSLGTQMINCEEFSFIPIRRPD